jgi:hypothetical protein
MIDCRRDNLATEFLMPERWRLNEVHRRLGSWIAGVRLRVGVGY